MSATDERRRVVTWQDPVATARAGLALSGLDYLNAVVGGALPPPPITALVGFTLETVEPGRAMMVLTPGEHHYNPLGAVHGGIAATLLDSVMGCAVHTTLPVGRGYTTVEIKINYLKAMTATTGAVRAEGKIVQVGRQIAMAEGRITDDAGRLYAAGTATCLVFDLPPSAAR
ncbi:MAG: PaaI family thioesterase [Proteobacteria bacterium]|nr:PaaI family thioesterase [Pseudomonadota bacterium]